MKFNLHKSFDTLKPLAARWNTLVESGVTNACFLRYEYLESWWQTRGGGEWKNEAELSVITAWEDDVLIGIAPLFLANNRDDRPALLLLGSIEISDYLDLITSPENHSRFTTGLLDWLISEYPPEWQVLDWYNIPEVSPTLLALHEYARQNNKNYIEDIYQPCPAIPLPGDFEVYLSQLDKKQRHEIRRKIRRAEESGRGVRWYMVDDQNRLEDEMNAFLALMANDPDKEVFLTPTMREQMHQTAQIAFEYGFLQLAFLEVDGKKACAYLNFDYNNKIWVYNSGIDKNFMDLSVGWVLLGYLLEWANNQHRSEFDFLRGDEDYKFKFGGQKRHVMRLQLSN